MIRRRHSNIRRRVFEAVRDFVLDPEMWARMIVIAALTYLFVVALTVGVGQR